jgi:hypothetical protein
MELYEIFHMQTYHGPDYNAMVQSATLQAVQNCQISPVDFQT